MQQEVNIEELSFDDDVTIFAESRALHGIGSRSPRTRLKTTLTIQNHLTM